METGMMTMTKKWHTTHIQPHEPLLVGWFICGMTTMTTMSNNSKNNGMTTDNWEVMRTRETE
jgi:hypothetical protein